MWTFGHLEHHAKGSSNTCDQGTRAIISGNGHHCCSGTSGGGCGWISWRCSIGTATGSRRRGCGSGGAGTGATERTLSGVKSSAVILLILKALGLGGGDTGVVLVADFEDLVADEGWDGSEVIGQAWSGTIGSTIALDD